MSRRTAHVAPILTALVLSTVLAGAAPAHLPRHPAPSPDGSLIAFSWQGDLWTVPAEGGAARRLTAHPAVERHPVWSRDGRLIAFTSDRAGNDDVYVLRIDGAEAPQRLTFASVDDVPVDFSPDGAAVLFTSSRAESVRWMPGLYRVPLAGGTPALYQDALGRSAATSPDGRSTAFVRGSTKWWRHGYRGAANRDLWLRGPDGGYVQLTDHPGDDDHPGWVDDQTIVFLGDRTGQENLFLLDVPTGGVQELTRHSGTGARYPRVAADGSLVAYELEDEIWTVAPEPGSVPRRLEIDVPLDRLTNELVRRTATSDADGLAVHPDGDLVAFTVHGDVFLTELRSEEELELAEPPTLQVTATPAREKDLTWSPDGSTLVFASEREGSYDLHAVRRSDPEAEWTTAFDLSTEQLTADAEEETLAKFSPDGERLAFVRGTGTLAVIPATGGEPTVLVDHWETPDYAWSPDGRWIAYSIPDAAYNHEVWIVSSEGGTPYNVSRHPDDDLTPRWSPDGRRLVWISKRHADTYDVWGAWLTRADHERTPDEWVRLFRAEKENEEETKKATTPDPEDADGEEGDTQELPTVEIELDRLWERAVPITSLAGDEDQPLVVSDGRRVLFTSEHEGERDLYSVRFDGEDLQRLTREGTRPDDLQEIDDETVAYLTGKGTIARIGVDGTAGDPVPFSARYAVDRRAERAVVFDEVWRALRERFYDPDFHGVDWQAMRAVYEPWALDASHDADFADVVNLMLGELNASHMGYYPPPQEGGETSGWLGVRFDPTAGGPGILVRQVLPDSPASRHDVSIVPGERILAVGGETVAESANVYELLVDTAGRRVPILLQGADGTERTVVVTPVRFSELDQLRYREWVRQRRALVDELAGGRIGYVHIQSMDIPSFETFERDLHAAAHGREALLIDVRSNGGGWTTDYLLAVLTVRRHAYTVPRDADPTEKVYPQSRLPLAAWTRPAATLCNEDSYSNAEIFSHAFKTLERGPLVGTPTFGAVISTGGTRLINGAWVRLPFRGWFVAGTDANMERIGAQPDVLVAQPPAEDTSADTDTQLARAVEVLLDGLEEDARYGAW